MYPQELKNKLCRSWDAPKRWEKLSELHEDIMKELEDIITTFIKGECGSGGKECKLPVVYGIYGSGKTTLLVTICEWALDNRIPAMRVLLSDVVEYLSGRVKSGKISEDRLLDYIEEYFKEKMRSYGISLKNERGVIIIDEIEESYDRLKEMVIGRSVLRGLADKARTGSASVIPILGFAPGSVLAEAVLQQAVAWRVKVFSMPSIPVSVIKSSYLDNIPIPDKLARYKDELKTLIANTLWWLSKGGKPGWLWDLVEAKVPHAILTTLRYIVEGNDVTKVESCFEPPMDISLSEGVRKTLSKEPVQGAPLFNYAEFKTKLGDLTAYHEDVQSLFKILACLVGPVSENIIEDLLGPRIRVLKLPSDIIVKSKQMVNKSVLIKKFIEYVSVSGRGSRLDKLEKVLREILDPWSLGDNVIYDKEGLKTLLGEILQLRLMEDVEEELLKAVDEIDLEGVIEEVSSKVIDGDKYYYALRPQVLRLLSPPATMPPLIACSKGIDLHRLVGDLRMIGDNVSQYILHDNEIKKYLENKRLALEFILSPESLEKLRSRIARSILADERRVAIILFSNIPGLDQFTGAKQEISNRYSGLLDKLIFVVEPPSILAQYLLGLLYTKAKCPTDPLTTLEKIIDSQAKRQLIAFLEEKVIEKSENFIREMRGLADTLSDIEVVKELVNLENRAYAKVGSEHGTYIWIMVSTPSQKSMFLMTRILEGLRKLRELSKLEYYEELGEDTFKGIKELLDNGINYINEIDKNLEILRRNYYNEFDEVREFLGGLIELHSDICTDPWNVVESLVKVWLNMGLPQQITSSKILFGWLALKPYCEKVNKVCNDKKVDFREPLASILNSLEQLRGKLRELREAHGIFLQTIRERVGLTTYDLSKLDSALNKLRESSELLYEISRETVPLCDNLVMYYYLNHLLKYFDIKKPRLRTVLKNIESLKDSLNGITGIVRECSDLCEKLKLPGLEEAYNICMERLRGLISPIISSRGLIKPIGIKRLEDLRQELEKFKEELNSVISEAKNILEAIKRANENAENLRRKLLR
jgi:hypothetical protein